MNNNNMDVADKALLTIGEACEYLGIKPTKARAFLKNELHCLVKIGSRSLYDKAKIDTWLDTQRTKG